MYVEIEIEIERERESRRNDWARYGGESVEELSLLSALAALHAPRSSRSGEICGASRNREIEFANLYGGGVKLKLQRGRGRKGQSSFRTPSRFSMALARISIVLSSLTRLAFVPCEGDEPWPRPDVGETSFDF